MDMAEADAANEPWFEDEDDLIDDSEVKEYDITSSPNDFNVLTLFNFVESGAVEIPAFQRNYVWDLKRASRLIESLILGLPIPQIFLYETGRNKYLVIDGQQRLMSIYFFMKGRFPRKEKRALLRDEFNSSEGISPSLLSDDSFFHDFALNLPSRIPAHDNRLNRRTYTSLAEYKLVLDLRPIRNIIIKQNLPQDDDSSIYEIFHRLNSGGVNLTPQEIRSSLYHSRFYDFLYSLNKERRWQLALGTSQPDLHLKDVEILLRGFAMLVSGTEYTPSMVRFLNRFSKNSKRYKEEDLLYFRQLSGMFLSQIAKLGDKPFHGRRTNKFNISLFEAVFAATLQKAYADHSLDVPVTSRQALDALKEDKEFLNASQYKTTSTENVVLRLQRAKSVLFGG